jgi:hypothetical protein
VVQQFAQNVSDGMLSAGDTAYHDSLEYYEAVKEAGRHACSRRRTGIRSAEKVFQEKQTGDNPDRRRGIKIHTFHSERIPPDLSSGGFLLLTETVGQKYGWKGLTPALG